MTQETIKSRVIAVWVSDPSIKVEALATQFGTSDTYIYKILKEVREGRVAKVDQFGFRVGTQVSEAAAMFAQGATMREVKEAVGRTCYTMLHKLKKKGHKIIKTMNADGKIVFTLVPDVVLELKA